MNLNNIRVRHGVSKAKGVVIACGVIDGAWNLLVKLDLDSERHTSIHARSVGPGSLTSWFLSEVIVEGSI